MRTFNEARQIVLDFINEIAQLDKKERYDFIVLANTRTLCLMYGMKEVKLKAFYNKMISFEKVDIVANDFKGKKILIADFMMMLGIYTARVYDAIKKYDPIAVHTTIHIKKVMVNEQYISYCNKNPNDKVFVSSYEPGVDYNELLCRMTQFLYSINQPYISSTYAFNVPKEEYSRFIKSEGILKKSFNNKIDFHPFNARIKYFDCTKIINKKYITAAFIRTYKSNGSNQFIIIPYVELAPLTTKQVEDIWKSLNIPIKIETIVDKYKVIKAILSFALYKKYFNYKLNESKWIDASFVKSFINIIERSINISTIFDEVEKIIGEIKYPKYHNFGCLEQGGLNLYKDNEISASEYLQRYCYVEFNRHEEHCIICDGYICENFIETGYYKHCIGILPIHELLTNISTKDLTQHYAMLLYFFDTDIIMPRIYINDDFVETYLDIYYC